MDSNRIFVVGAGRSGTTVFFDILSRHRQMHWLAGKLCNRYPRRPHYNRSLMRLVHAPLVGRALRRLYEPGECYPFWNTLYPGFGSTYRDLLAADVSERARRHITSTLARTVGGESDRLLMKITGWNRMGFLNEIYPGASFIHVSRDARAVMNSNINVYFWKGWMGPSHLLAGEPADETRAELQRFDNSFVALAGLRAVAVRRAYLDARRHIPDERLLDVTYEAMCADPVALYRRVCEYLGIEWYAGFETIVGGIKLVNTNFKWQQDLSPAQQEIAQYYYEKLNALV